MAIKASRFMVAPYAGPKELITPILKKRRAATSPTTGDLSHQD